MTFCENAKAAAKNVVARQRVLQITPYNGNATVDLISSIDNKAVTLCTRTSEISA